MQITRSGGNNATEAEDGKSIWYNDPDIVVTHEGIYRTAAGWCLARGRPASPHAFGSVRSTRPPPSRWRELRYP
jgi:hypothetical protein